MAKHHTWDLSRWRHCPSTTRPQTPTTSTGICEASLRRLAGFSQAKASRMEAGRFLPSPQDADRYACALGAPAAIRRQLVAMARDLHEQHRAATPARVSLSRSAATHEQRVRRNEARSTHLSVFHPLMIPGLLQTEEYVRAVFTSGTLPQPEVDARVTARLARAEILQEPGHQFTNLAVFGDEARTEIRHIADNY